MKIAELSRVSGTHRSTIHHYLDLGLLPRPETLGPRRHHFGFGEEHVERLRETQALRAQGLGLGEIRQLWPPRRSWRSTSRGAAKGAAACTSASSMVREPPPRPPGPLRGRFCCSPADRAGLQRRDAAESGCAGATA